MPIGRLGIKSQWQLYDLCKSHGFAPSSSSLTSSPILLPSYLLFVFLSSSLMFLFLLLHPSASSFSSTSLLSPLFFFTSPFLAYFLYSSPSSSQLFHRYSLLFSIGLCPFLLCLPPSSPISPFFLASLYFLMVSLFAALASTLRSLQHLQRLLRTLLLHKSNLLQNPMPPKASWLKRSTLANLMTYNHLFELLVPAYL